MAKADYKLRSLLNSQAIDVKTNLINYTVDYEKSNDVVTSIKNDEYILPKGSIITLKTEDGYEVKMGDGENVWSDSASFGGSGGDTEVDWDSVTDKPTTFAPIIGTTATTAKAGNYTPPTVTTTVNGLMLSTDKVKLDGVTAGTVTPLANGTASIGTSTAYARQDHVHPLQTSVATLTTGRTIAITGGVTGVSAPFNGSSNISFPAVLATPTSELRGGILAQPNIADISERPVDATDINAILTALRNAGILI